MTISTMYKSCHRPYIVLTAEGAVPRLYDERQYWGNVPGDHFNQVRRTLSFAAEPQSSIITVGMGLYRGTCKSADRLKGVGPPQALIMRQEDMGGLCLIQFGFRKEVDIHTSTITSNLTRGAVVDSILESIRGYTSLPQLLPNPLQPTCCHVLSLAENSVTWAISPSDLVGVKHKIVTDNLNQSTLYKK